MQYQPEPMNQRIVSNIGQQNMTQTNPMYQNNQMYNRNQMMNNQQRQMTNMNQVIPNN